jgi:hypothetical protein
MPILRRTLIALLLLAAAIPAWAETLTGRVIAIADGDTRTLLTTEWHQIRVRPTASICRRADSHGARGRSYRLGAELGGWRNGA